MTSTANDEHQNEHPDLDVDFSNIYIRFPKIWEDSVDVQWSRQLFDGRKVHKYQLAAVGSNFRVERYFSPSEHDFRLTGLVPGMQIEVKVRVLVESPSRGPMWCAWAEGLVETLKSTTISVATVSSSLVHGRITWGSELVKTGPTPTHVAVAAEKYQVKVRQKGKFLTNDVCEREFPADSTEFIIEDMESNALLEVQARAISVFGDIGKWCDPVRFLTLSPVEVSVSEIGETYSIVHWQRSEENDNVNTNEGAIEELVVVVELLPSQRELDVDSQAQKVQVAAERFSNETRTYRVRDLIPGRTYHVRTRYRNALGDWTPWTMVKVATLFPIDSPDVQLVGHNFVQVKWQRCEPDDGSFADATKDVDVWEVRCSVGRSSTTMVLPVSECETKLVNLHSGVDYSIDVRAKSTSGEWGLWSTSVTVTTLHRLAPRIDFAGETWMKVSWNRQEKKYNDNITRYHVQLNAVNSPFRIAKYFPADITTYTFENLKPGTEFHVVMQAFSDQRWGPWSEPTECSTCSPCVAQLIRRGEDFVQVRWNSEYYLRSSVENLDRIFQVKILRPKTDEEDGEHSSPPCILQEEEVTNGAFRINRLPAFSRVIVQVRGFDYSMQQWCDWGPEKMFRTLPSAIVKTHIGETFVSISWSRAPRIVSAVSDEDMESGMEDALSPDVAKKFVLRLNEVNADGEHVEKSKFHFDSDQPTTFTLTELTPDTVYSLQLCFLDNSQNWSPQSAPIRFRTAPQIQLVITDVGEGFCSMEWGRWFDGKKQIAITETNFKISLKDVTCDDDVPIQVNVQGTKAYTVRDLQPSTLYRIQVCAAPQGGTVWGGWSDPVFVCTTPALEGDLDLVGEDYANISWKRLDRVTVLSLLPECRTVVVGPHSLEEGASRTPPKREAKENGQVVYVGNEQVLEYHFQLLRIVPPPQDEPGALPYKELVEESKLHSSQQTIRVGSLVANAQYQALICSSTLTKEWGVWSNPLTFRTSMPTEVYVAEMSKDAVIVQWGKGGSTTMVCDATSTDNSESTQQQQLHSAAGSSVSSDRSDVLNYQIKIDGTNNEHHFEAELPGDQYSYVIRGLSLNTCYSVVVRSFHISDNEWGKWCHPIYIVVKVVPVVHTETSQDWAQVSWANKPPPDRRPKAQFLSIFGENMATVHTLPSDTKSYAFTKLQPSTLYTAHLVTIEQSAVPVTPTPSSQLTQNKDAMITEMLNHSAPFALPVVATDFREFLVDGLVFRTQRALELTIETVGQNFLLLKWKAVIGVGEKEDDDYRLEEDTFEVEVAQVEDRPDQEDQQSNKKLIRITGTKAFIRHLKPDTTVRCCVRWVAERTELPSQWSKPAVTKLLPMIEPQLGAESNDSPGLGEDYLIIHWGKSLKNAGFRNLGEVSFEVRITAVEGTSQLDRTFETQGTSYHFTELEPDTQYKIEVRTVVVHESDGEQSEKVNGEWSEPILCTTLSPMAVAVAGIVENGAVVHWRRRNCAVGDCWWETGDEDKLRTEIASISSFHVRVTSGTSGDDTSNPVTVFDEQFADHHQQFSQCCTRLKSLKPGGKYCVSVRSSTGMLWGAWSTPVIFHTQQPCTVNVPLVGEHFVVAEWKRQAGVGLSSPVRDAQVTEWELAFKTVGASEGVDTTVTAPQETTKHCIGGLKSNWPYTICVRPKYIGDEWGPWSEPVYFITLAPFIVDVGKVGETFVQVSWERDVQETIQRRMKHKNIEATRLMDGELRELEERLDLCRQSSVGSGVIAGENEDHSPATLDALEEEGSDYEDDEEAAAYKANTEADERYLQEQITQLQAKIQHNRKLTSMQVAELEKTAVYPKGDDMKYELLVYGGAPEGEQQPFLFKRRLGKGETFCRLESLNPKTIYEVTIRSLFSNAYSLKGVPMMLIEDTDEVDDVLVPWGAWSTRTRFVTLKPIVTSAKSIGSECIAVEWDTGGMDKDNEIDPSATLSSTAGGNNSRGGGKTALRTAITKFQVHVVDNRKGPNNQRPDTTLEEPTLKGYVVTGLHPNCIYSVTVRVCYEGDKWGVWSTPIQFITMPKLLCKLQSVAERQVEFLVWRDQQVPLPEGMQGVVVWNPPVSEHQLSINGMECAQSFELENGTSTMLTLDTLTIDTEYTIGVRDKVEQHWQDFKNILHCETVAFAPQRAMLRERKGNKVVIAWQHQRNISSRQYIYMVEMAVREDAPKKKLAQGALKRANLSAHSAITHGEFSLLGFTTAAEFQMELHYQVNHCYFRVLCCKTNLTIDGEPHPVSSTPQAPQSVSLDSAHYVWSQPSPIAHFKTPSVPDHPTNIHVVNLTHNSALLKWSLPMNYREHSNIVYRVYLNNSYGDKFTCVAETTETKVPLDDLVTNCHYRVSVTAESTMGSSIQNNTLHFSTKVTPHQLPPGGLKRSLGGVSTRSEKPMTSTLPPRAALHAPDDVIEASRAMSPHRDPGEFGALLDETASTVFGAVKMSVKRASPVRSERSISPGRQ